jgi:hypothetical protein
MAEVTPGGTNITTPDPASSLQLDSTPGQSPQLDISEELDTIIDNPNYEACQKGPTEHCASTDNAVDASPPLKHSNPLYSVARQMLPEPDISTNI